MKSIKPFQSYARAIRESKKATSNFPGVVEVYKNGSLAGYYAKGDEVISFNGIRDTLIWGKFGKSGLISEVYLDR